MNILMDASTLKMVSSTSNGWSMMMKKNHKLMMITMLYSVDVTRGDANPFDAVDDFTDVVFTRRGEIQGNHGV